MCCVWMISSARQQMDLGASEEADEDEDVACERSRVSSGDVGDDVLVLQNLTKVRTLPFSSSITTRTTSFCSKHKDWSSYSPNGVSVHPYLIMNTWPTQVQSRAHGHDQHTQTTCRQTNTQHATSVTTGHILCCA